MMISISLKKPLIRLSVLLYGITLTGYAQSTVTTSLNGQWEIIVDSYGNGYFNYRLQPRNDGFF